MLVPLGKKFPRSVVSVPCMRLRVMVPVWLPQGSPGLPRPLPMLTPRRVPSGRFTFFTSTTSVVSKLPLVTLASARARPSGTTPPMAGPESLASVVVPPACATPEPVVTSTLAMARPMRTLDHVAFMTSRFLPHAWVLRPDQPPGSAARISRSTSNNPLPDLELVAGTAASPADTHRPGENLRQGATIPGAGGDRQLLAHGVDKPA